MGFFPTPLQHMSRLGEALGHDALKAGADTVVTAGGLQSNLCSLTAAACAKAGLRCVLVHNDLRPAELHGNMLLSHLFGAEPGHPFHVHVISVEYRRAELHRRISALLAGISDLTGLKPTVDPHEVMTIHDTYLGDGYGVPTPESLEAASLLSRTEGLFTENVYTSKTLAGLIGLIRDGTIHPSEAACFVHTGGMAALFAQ